MMTKDTKALNKQTVSFNESVDLFFGMNPKSSNWLLLALYFSKERVLEVVENYTDSDDNIFLRLDIDDISDNKIVAEWNSANIRNKCIIINYLHYSYQVARDLVEEINNDIYYNQGSSNSKNIFLIDRWEPTYLFQIAERFMSLSDEWYSENAAWAFDVIVRRIQNQQGIQGGFFVQPREITELAVKLLDATSGSVYDPYAGVCSYAIMLDDKCAYYGQEFCTPAYVAGKLNLLINGKNNARLDRCISTEHWCGIEENNFDYIISTPPFGLRLSNSTNHVNTAELDLLVRASKDARKRSVGVYTASMCLNVSQAHYRVYQNLVDSDLIDKVILLPHNTLPFTAITPVVIVTNKEKKNRGKIRFVDASEMYVVSGRGNCLNLENKFFDIISAENVENLDWVKDVALEEVSSIGYKLYPKLYLRTHAGEWPEGYLKKDFYDVARIYSGTKALEGESGHLVKISGLAISALDCERQVEDFEYTENLGHAVKVTEPVILLSRANNERPTYCEASIDRPIFVHPNVVAYRIIQDWVSPHYLCYELDRRIFKAGKGVPLHNGRAWLITTGLAFPSFCKDEQDKIAAAARLQYKEEKAREMGLQEVIDKMKSEYINEIRTRKHDMRPHLRNLRSTERLIRHYLTSCNDMPEMTEKISGLLDRWKVSLEQLSNLVDIFSDEDHFGTPELLDLHKYFSQLVSHYDFETHGFEMKYECDSSALEEIGFARGNSVSKEYSMLNGLISFKYEKSSDDFALFTHIASIDLDRLVTNIVENAREHGFTNNQRNDYMVRINLSVNPKRRMFQIDFINNGTPLPSGLDKLRYGMRGEKAGATGRSGNGGYVVKSVVEHYKGDFDVFMDDMGTVIRVLLPISEHNNE